MSKYEIENLVFQGFFIRTCFEAVCKLADHAAKSKKIFALNLSAEYICQKFGDLIMKLLPSVDYLFANEQVDCQLVFFSQDFQLLI